MKNDTKAEAIRYWWDKAVESLKAARRDLAAQSFSFAINRAYYAVFYAVSALFLEEGRRFQKHSGVRATLNQHLIKTGRLARKHGDLFPTNFQMAKRGFTVPTTLFSAWLSSSKVVPIKFITYAVLFNVSQIFTLRA